MRIKPVIILIVGANGQVGWELQRTMAPLGSIIGADVSPIAGGVVLDLTHPETLAAVVEAIKPSVIINAAAYTAVDRAESEPELATVVNTIAVAELGRLAAKANIPIVHYSTDFVFSGVKTTPYLEDDLTGPLNVYGATKLAGEQALLASGAACLVLRTSWVYGVRGRNFLLTMRELFNGQSEVRVVDDRTGSPTWSRLLAEVTAQVVGRSLCGEVDFAGIQGVYHVSGGGSVTWYGFAQAIHEHIGSSCRLIPVSSYDYPAPAPRPVYSVLDNGKLQKVFGISLPHWQRALDWCCRDICVDR